MSVSGVHSPWRGSSFLFGFLIPVGVLAGCREAPPPEVSPEESAEAVRVGEAATGELLRTLVGRLTVAMEEGGAAHAAEFCSVDAIPLTRLVEAKLGGGISLKRTSFRYRNAANAPDSAEELALRYFEDAVIEGGEQPSHYIQRVSDTEVRFYKPLFLGEFCLRCHGDPDGLDPGVAEVLRENYPGDLATGYEAGAFRGVVRVGIPLPPPEG
jgi:hypothetical protein